MTTNGEWLFSKPFEEQVAWMNAEHQDGTLDGDTDALNAKIAELERKLRISWEYECKFQDERDELQEQVDTLRSRHCPHYDATEHTCDVHETRIAELTAERDELKGQVFTLKCECDDLENERDKLQEQLRIGWECECRLQAERERYREKFGKCIDYADAIHALMDEGMA